MDSSKACGRLLALVLLGAVALAGCEPGDPQERYNYDLGDDQLTLLPRHAALHAAHDSGIMSGSVQADIHKREDAGSPEVQAAAAKPQAAKPAESMSEALSTIGNALLGRGPSSPESVEKLEDQASDAPGSTPPAGDLVADDAAAIRELVDRYNQVAASRDLDSLVAMHTESQKPAAVDWYEINADLLGTLDALGNALEQKEAGSKAQIDAIAGSYVQRRFVLSADGLSPTGEDAVQGNDATFRRVDGQWVLELAAVPSADAMEGMREKFRTAETRLEELTDAVINGSMDAATVAAEAEKALADLSTP